ncbi:HPr(Ser) kinase/phosphatase, partial [Clostridium saudiense]|nr:HPr(Ser) kinase/phosphatase [Clostridium saudiense]
VITRGLEPHEEFVKAAKKNKTWLLRSKMVTTNFISKMTIYLADKFAPETRLHGVLVDVNGIGILITGESGIGKSETALELIKRGHRLVTDDAVDIREIDGSLIGTSPRITIGMLEVRGIGIIDIPSLYGVSSILQSKSINLIMHFEHWKDDGDYDRLGTNQETQEILGVNVKKLRIPIRPGRNIAVIIEAAAVNYRHSLMSDVTPVDIIESRMAKDNN